MSHGKSPVTLSDVPAIVTAQPLVVSVLVKATLGILVLTGVIALAVGIYGDPQRTFVALQVNFSYWLVLAATSACFAAVFHITNAQWSRPLRRIFESTFPYFKWSLLIFIPMWLFGHHYLFEASHSTIHGGKAVWLSKHFLYGRDLVALILLVLLAGRVIKLSLRQDIGAIRSGLTGLKRDELHRWHTAEYDSYFEGWGEDARKEIAEAQDRKGFLSPVVVIVYSIVFSLFAFDQLMAIDPHWFSTLFGAFIFMSGVYITMAWNAIGVGFLRELHPLFRAKIYRTTMHDLGKLLFGFGIFWAYLFWSQYLTIWYGNLPEETGWLILRTRLEPWHGLAWGVLWTCFFFPFMFGLNIDAKRVPKLLFLTACVVATGIWLQFFLIVAPSFFPHHIPAGFVEAGITAGFLGLFLWGSITYLAKVPLIPFGDLYIKQANH